MRKTCLFLKPLAFLTLLCNASHGQEHSLHKSKNRILEEDESTSFMSSQSDFEEIITARMSYVPSLLSQNEQETLSTTLENIVVEKSNNEFSDVQVQILRQMIERKRRDDDMNDELVLILSISGSGLQDSNVGENIKEELSSGVVKEIRQISDYEPFFTNVTDFKIIQTPKAFNAQPQQEIEPFNAPNIVVMETTNDDDSAIAAGDIAAIIGVCVLTVGLVALIGMGSVFLRRNNKEEKETYHEDSNSTIETIMHRFEKESTKDRLRNKSGSGRNNSHYVKKHPWKNDNNANNEFLFVHPNDDPDMLGADISPVLRDDDDEVTESTYRGEFIAPPGKLGVAVDTLDSVPVVHRIKPGSPLQGILYPMDKIICIDEVNTSSMTAGEVTKLMVARMTRPRRITYLRGGDRNYSVRPDNEFEMSNSFDSGSGSI